MRAIPCFELGIKCGSIAMKNEVSHTYVYHVDFPSFDIPLPSEYNFCVYNFFKSLKFFMVA